MAWLVLLVSGVLESLWAIALKRSEGFTRLVPSVVVVVGYCCAFYLMGHVLKTLPLGFTYAIWSGVGTASAALIGWLYFRGAFQWGALV